jgi:outer membrane receptor protein involved in Fe transport
MKCHAIPVLVLFALLASFLLIVPNVAFAQSLTSGSVSGTITDPSGAAMSGATVNLKNDATGVTQTVKSNSTGAYRFNFLNPGNYTVSATQSGFQPVQHPVTVAVGTAGMVNLQLQVATASTTVEVSGEGGLVQTENGNVSTTISPQIVANMPNPGNDLTFFEQIAPGATMNTQAGYGNTSFFGISATSNYFTVDGMSENDPFLNLNNSGATNLMLGANDIDTATVVSNGYSGQYGTLAGANVNYVTKSGGNKFHGNAEYFWNGRVLNANDWFNNNTGTPRPFDNANQWAASIGGPIRKDKTFFFIDQEGLRLLIPTAVPVNIPSPQFQAATLGTLAADGNAAEIPFYNKFFGIYNNAPGTARALNSLPAGGCDGSVTLAGGAPCALQFRSNIDNLTTEWLLTARVDENFGNRDHAFIHFRTDHGLQASITDPFTPVLNSESIQPQYEGQIQENHQFGSNAVNQFIVAGSWYGAVFAPPNLAAATSLIPYDMSFSSGEFTTPGNSTFYGTWPQGRKVTQYQISDDFAWQRGRHDLKFGVDFRRNDITDYTPGGFNATIPTANFASEASFLTGSADTFVQAFATRPTQPLAIYNLGLYAEDGWEATHDLKLTLSLRVEHNSNPVCQTNCFARFNNSFGAMSHDPAQPYNQAIVTGLHSALPGFEAIAWEPRLGVAWQPLGNGKTVVRGGIGLFADIFPGTIATSFDTNSPLKNTFVVPGGFTGTVACGTAGCPITGTVGAPVAAGVPGNESSLATASNGAFVTGFNSGLNLAQITTAVPTFSPPAFVNANRNISYPKYVEWNLELEQAIGSKSSVDINYVGNHGYNLALINPVTNAFCNASCTAALGVTSFVGLPTAPPDSRFSTISEVSNPGVSNYDGLVLSFTRRVSSAFQLQASFTYSHALDDISNSGFLPFNLQTNTSILSPQNPYNLRQYNYGNADYDARKQVNLVWTYNTPKIQRGWLNALANWTFSGVMFYHSGYPFTAIDGPSTFALNSYNYGPAGGTDLFANDLVHGTVHCSSANKFNSAVTNPACMTTAQFTSAVVPGSIGTFGAQRRNQIFGPGFFDLDATLMKNFRLWSETSMLQIGAQAFNVLNHPNFDQPVGDIGNPQFGYSILSEGTPTSIFGSFLGANAAPRALQIRAQIVF